MSTKSGSLIKCATSILMVMFHVYSEKDQDELVEETAPTLETEDEQSSMPESVNTTQSGSGGGFHYQIRNPDNGQVTYRVVQVGGDENNQQATLSIVTTNGILNQLSQDEGSGGGSPQEQVAIVANPFNNDSGNESAANTASSNATPGSQRFAYFAASNTSTDLSSPTSTGSTTAGQTEQQLLSSGQFYVMMSPQEVLQSSTTGTPQRAILGRTSFQARTDDTRNTRDDSRRVQHNEVERRRRDKINTWILKLGTIIPDCANDHTKQGQSKGGILAKAFDYIVDLQHANSQLSESLKDCEQLQLNYEMCRQQLEDSKQKVQLLTQTLQAHQIDFPTSQAQP
uniref:upstream stimulatory factor-like isoform X2 n=1 Tax=Styela clava TaxID=7725 RepID=UPI00193A5E29|nr:upstream stimulatory factor-like isoform X2 [Styela clava]